ncbi:hypothetical protein C2U70_25685 [Bradyrhizobium guangdongense]|nr:hypothetical protein C2U70_25685 [Bradyrhizobium guangdongense]
MDLVIFLLAILLWWTVEAIVIGSPSIAGSSTNYMLGFVLAIFAFPFWIPTIAAAATSEFAFSFLPTKWRSLAYLGFVLVGLAALSLIAHSVFEGEARTEHFRLLVYPAVAVGILYVARNFAREQN